MTPMPAFVLERVQKARAWSELGNFRLKSAKRAALQLFDKFEVCGCKKEREELGSLSLLKPVVEGSPTFLGDRSLSGGMAGTQKNLFFELPVVYVPISRRMGFWPVCEVVEVLVDQAMVLSENFDALESQSLGLHECVKVGSVSVGQFGFDKIWATETYRFEIRRHVLNALRMQMKEKYDVRLFVSHLYPCTTLQGPVTEVVEEWQRKLSIFSFGSPLHKFGEKIESCHFLGFDFERQIKW